MKIVLLTLLGFGAFVIVVAVFFLLTKYWSDKFLGEEDKKKGKKKQNFPKKF